MDNLRLEIEWDVDNEQLQNDINKSKKNIEGVGQTIDQVQKKVHEGLAGLLSDSAAEIEQYKKSLVGLSELKAPSNVLGMDDLSNKLDEIEKAKVKLVGFYNSGRMSAEDYKLGLATLIATEKQLTKEIAERNNYTPTNATAEVQLTKEQQLLKIVANEYKAILKESSAVYDQLPTKVQNSVASLIRQKEELAHVRDAMQNVQSAYAAGELSSTQHEQALARLIVLESQLSAEIKTTADTARRGFEEQNISATKHEGLLQRMQREAALYQKGMLEATRADNLEKYRAKLEGVNAEMSKLTKGANIGGGSGWNGLQNSINQLSRELPAFTYSVQTGFMAMSNNIPIFIDEINRLRAANEALNASGQKGVPVWKQVVGAIFSWQTAMGVGILLMTAYGKEIGEWIKALFKGKQALDNVKLSKQSLDEAFKDTSLKKAVVDINNVSAALEMYQNKTLSKKAVIEEYNKSIGRTTGVVKSLDEVERFLIDNADNYIKMTLYKAAANKSLEEAASSALEAEKARLKELNEFANNFLDATPQARTEEQWKQQQAQILKNQQKRKDAEVKIHEDAEKQQIDISKKFLKSAQEYASKMGISIFGDGVVNQKQLDALAKAYEEMLKVSKEGLAKIKDLDIEYSILNLSDEEKEKEALRKKFADFRKVLEEENKKIVEYNEKNKANVALIDISQVAPIEQRAESQLQYKQDTNALNKEIEEQKKIYEAYENYKSKLGKSAADEKFKNDLKGFENYAQYLDSVIAKESEAFAAVENKTATAGQEARVKGLEKEAEDALKVEKQKYIDMLAALMDFNARREKIIEDAEAKIAELIKTGNVDQVSQARKARDKELLELTRSEINDNEIFKNLEKNIERAGFSMSVKAIKMGRDVVDSIIAGAKMTTEQKAKLQKEFDQYFDKLEVEIKNDQVDGVQSLVVGFDALVQNATSFDSSLQNSLRTVSAMIGTVGQLSSVMAKMTASKSLESLGKGLGIFGAFAGVVGGVSSFFAQKQAAAQQQMFDQANRSTQMQLKATEAITQALQKQVSLIEEIYGADRLSKYNTTLGEIKGTWNELNSQLSGKYQLSGFDDIDDIITKLNNGLTQKDLTKGLSPKKQQEIISKIRDIQSGKYGGAFSPLSDDIKKAQEELLKLEQLATSGRADENTQNLINQLRKQVDLYNEVTNKLKEEVTGNSFSGILNDVKSLFLNSGADAGEAWSKGFDKVLENYMLQKFTRDYLQEQMQGWYNMMDEFAKDGISGSERDILKSEWDKIQKEGEKRLDAMRDVLGLDKGSSSSTLASSGIERITEQSATEWIGIGRAHIDVSKQHLTISKTSLEFEMKSHNAIVENLLTQKAIEANTAETVSQLKLVVGELKMVNKNTGGKYGG